VLDISQGDSNKGRLIIYNKHFTKQPNQVFRFVDVGNGSYQIISCGLPISYTLLGGQ
jgi:hypothetical protein